MHPLRTPAPLSVRARRARTSTLGAAAILACAGLAAPAVAGDKSWTGFNGGWFNAGNWFPNGVPGAGDDAYIGNIPQGINAIVGMGGPPTATFNFLQVSNGATLDSNGTEIVSTGQANLVGANSRIIARPSGAGPNFYDLQAIINIGAGARLEMRNNVPVRMLDGSTNSGEVVGSGLLQIIDTNSFNNNGLFIPDAHELLTVRINAAGDGEIDLDGASGNGSLFLNNAGAQLDVIAQSLADDFSSYALLAPGAELTMAIADGWRADASSEIEAGGFGIPAPTSILDGDEVSIAGDLNLTGTMAKLDVNADAVLEPTITVSAGADCDLQFAGTTDVQGGTFDLADGATLVFSGQADVTGAVFTTFGPAPADGAVAFEGSTQFSGTNGFSGYARTDGVSSTSGNTTINAEIFDLDGNSGNGVWNVASITTVNAERIDVNNNIFNGDITVAGGILSRLAINLDDPGDPWVMDGSMTVSGLTHLPEQRLTGNEVIVTGSLENTGGRPVVSADAQFSTAGSPASVNTGPVGAELIMSGATSILANTGFSGFGTLVNSGSGEMSLEDGVDLNTSLLYNNGTVSVGPGSGSATVPGFFQGAGATWSVDIGGSTPGTEHDQLVVGVEDATVGGTLEVNLIDTGMGILAPSIGAKFTILTTQGSVAGQFDADPVTETAIATYYWDVVYLADSIVLVVDDIGPAPGCCPGNAQKDEGGEVDFGDITAVLMHWLESGDGSEPGDANCDGMVDFNDITSILENWGNACP